MFEHLVRAVLTDQIGAVARDGTEFVRKALVQIRDENDLTGEEGRGY